MINNRQSGRRRGRGGQRPPGMSGSSGNRQDNRQRGNAAQLLEKYKSMARDAQLGGDRVQAEYFLQFADHYFRMLSEGRSRFDDQRRGRDEEDGDGDDDEGADLVDADGEAEAEASERPQRRQVQARDREERPERSERQGRGNGRARDTQSNDQPDERIPFDVLPPAIGAEDSKTEDPSDSEDEAPRPRRRARRPRAEDGDSDVAPTA